MHHVDVAYLVGLQSDAAQALEVAEQAHRDTDQAETMGLDCTEQRGFELAAIGEALRTRDRFLDALALEGVRVARERRIQAQQREREVADERAAKSATKKALAIWSKAPTAPPDHPYLVAKGIGVHGLRVDRHGNLLVPLSDAEGQLHTLQMIGADGTKKFLRGGPTAGHFHILGVVNEAVPLLICEGLATGCSLAEDTAYPVAVAFSATNLRPVALAMRNKYPNATLVVCADADKVGMDKAAEAAQAVGALMVAPDFTGLPRGVRDKDFNDALRLLVNAEAPI